jgi:hypothetical protein
VGDTPGSVRENEETSTKLDQPPRRTRLDRATQVALPPLAIIGNALISMKKPQVGLLICLVSEFFWLYSGWIAWKRSGQVGMFITNCVIAATVAYGVFNYWLL